MSRTEQPNVPSSARAAEQAVSVVLNKNTRFSKVQVGNTSQGPSAGRIDGPGEDECLSGDDYADVLKASSDFFGREYRMQEKLTHIKVNREERWLVLPTTKRWCYIKEDQHLGIDPYIAVTDWGSRWMCPHEKCLEVNAPVIPYTELPKSLRALYTDLFLVFVDQEKMNSAMIECRESITLNFPGETPGEVVQVRNTLMTLAKRQICRSCGTGDKVHFQHEEAGWCMICFGCNTQWPNGLVKFPAIKHPNLSAVLKQLNVIHNTDLIDEPFADTYSGDGLVVFPEDEEKNALFLRALQGTDSVMSDLVFAVFKDCFHCCKIGTKGTDGMWYEFRDHCWNPKAELRLRRLLGGETFLTPFYRALQFYEHDCVQTDETKRKARHIKRVCEQLGNLNRRKRILEDAIVLFHEFRPNFARDLDTANMLVFTNGVYDFDSFTFRDGRPDDYLSVALTAPYDPVDWQSPDALFIMEFMSAIQPDEATRDYLLTVLSLSLTTDTTMQHIWIHTGVGANGKSKLMNFLMETLEDHFGTAPATLLTRRREDANQTNEALSALEKARIVVFSEGAASEVLQANTVKLLTGEDTITTRGLHEKQQRWKPCFKCHAVYNAIPKLDDHSWPIQRRIKVVHFPTLFVDNPRRPHERKKDPNVGERLAKCTGAFLSILIEYLRRFRTNGLVEAPAVTAATQKYQTDNDVFEEFHGAHLVEEEGASVEWTEALAAIRLWANIRRKKIPEKKSEIKALFVGRLGKIFDSKFRGESLYGWKHRRLVDDCVCCDHHRKPAESNCTESRGERLVRLHLELRMVRHKTQHTFPNCRHKRLLPFDFYIDHNGKRGCIEFQGRQHFEPVNDFGGQAAFED